MNKKLLTIGMAAVLLALANGCALFVVGAAAGVAGAGGYAYYKGEVKATEPTSLDRVWNATRAAMKDLEFPVTSQGKDALEGDLTARNASGKKIEIEMTKISDSATELRIRVGTFGDEALSRTILAKINSHL